MESKINKQEINKNLQRSNARPPSTLPHLYGFVTSDTRVTLEQVQASQVSPYLNHFDQMLQLPILQPVFLAMAPQIL